MANLMVGLTPPRGAGGTLLNIGKLQVEQQSSGENSATREWDVTIQAGRTLN